METTVQITNDLERRIADTFCIFDHIGDKTIDVREIGTVLRFLGCVPTEQQIHEVITATEMEDSSGEVQLLKFMPYMIEVLTERKMEPAHPEVLLNAFKLMDPENRGYVERDVLTKLMMEDGEPFDQEEIDEMMAIAVDPSTGHIPYEYYLNQLIHKAENSIFDAAAEVLAEKARHASKASSTNQSTRQSTFSRKSAQDANKRESK